MTGVQNFEKPRNGIRPDEALAAFKGVLALAEDGIGLRSNPDKEYTNYRSIIDRFIGYYSPKTKGYYSIHGIYIDFTEWAYPKLGYSYQELRGRQGWFSQEDVDQAKLLEQARAQAREKLPHWCHTDVEIDWEAQRILEMAS